jgi:curved DNA-binding protein CbpA
MDGTRARALLGVSEHASAHDLRRAFRQRALQTHPDHGGDAQAFADLVQALQTLEADAPNPAVVPRATAPTRVSLLRHVDTYDISPGVPRRVFPNHPVPSFAATLASAIASRR